MGNSYGYFYSQERSSRVNNWSDASDSPSLGESSTDNEEEAFDSTGAYECYRLSLFTRKTNPLTLLGEDKNHHSVNDKDRIRLKNSESNLWKSDSFCSVSTRSSRLSSISDCVYNPERDDKPESKETTNSDNLGEEEEYTIVDSIGCSPLISRTNSWSNLLEDELAYTQEELAMEGGDQPTWESDMTPSSERGFFREFIIVTTATLPWMTGTAVNPLLRAAYLSKRNRPHANGQSTVTLLIPWLESLEDRVALYGESWKHATKEVQEDYIRRWVCESAGLELESKVESGGIRIQFYPARYLANLSSIFAMGDLFQLIPETSSLGPGSPGPVCILEEPEHLLGWGFLTPGRQSWRDKFNHVVGVLHTNYKAYAKSHYSGIVTGPLVGAMSSLMVRAYCDKVIKLSDVLQSYAPEKEVSCNVHGIRNEFLSKKCTGNKVYFIGKLLWAKGLDKLISLQEEYRKITGAYIEMDIFGSGPEEEEIKRAYLQPFYSSSQTRKGRLPPMSPLEWRREPLPTRFMGRLDHAELGEEYKVFINPSITEVLCTTTAESIAMGKWVICPAHPSNSFFSQFPNCLQYSSKLEFVHFVQYALSNPPNSLDDDLRHMLTWDAATDRFLASACTSTREAARRDRVGKAKLDERIAKLHYEIGKGVRGDVLRKVFGAGPVAEQYKYENVLTNKHSAAPEAPCVD